MIKICFVDHRTIRVFYKDFTKYRELRFEVPSLFLSSIRRSDKKSFVCSQSKFSLNPLLPSENRFKQNVAKIVSQVLLGNFAK